MAQGQIEKRGDRTYRVRWFVGRDAKGKREYRSRTVHGTKRDAQRVLRKILGEHDMGRRFSPGNESLNRYLDR